MISLLGNSNAGEKFTIALCRPICNLTSRNEINAATQNVVDVLGCERKSARLIARESIFHNYVREIRNHFYSRISLNKAIAITRTLEVDPALIAAVENGGIINLLHMADYWRGILTLANALSENVKIGIPRKGGLSDDERAAFDTIKRIGRQYVTFDTTKPAATFNMIQFIRQGGVLIHFCDLPPFFGESTPVSFFGRKAHFLLGPAFISIIAKTPIHIASISMNPVTAAGRIRFVKRIEPHPDREKSGIENARDLTTRVAEVCELAIRDQPEEWRYWLFFEEFVHQKLHRKSQLRVDGIISKMQEISVQ